MVDEHSYDSVSLCLEDIGFLEGCCREINIDFTHSFRSQGFINERTRLLNYLVYLKIVEDPNRYWDLISEALESLRNHKNLHDHYYRFWRHFLDHNEFQRLYEKSDLLDEMRSSSPIPGGTIIGQLMRVKVFKYMDSKYNEKI